MSKKLKKKIVVENPSSLMAVLGVVGPYKTVINRKGKDGAPDDKPDVIKPGDELIIFEEE